MQISSTNAVIYFSYMLGRSIFWYKIVELHITSTIILSPQAETGTSLNTEFLEMYPPLSYAELSVVS